jgi:hypothetical protein
MEAVGVISGSQFVLKRNTSRVLVMNRTPVAFREARRLLTSISNKRTMRREHGLVNVERQAGFG